MSMRSGEDRLVDAGLGDRLPGELAEVADMVEPEAVDRAEGVPAPVFDDDELGTLGDR